MEQHHNLQELWMVPYADLMTIMVLFFLGLYCLSWRDKSHEQHEHEDTSSKIATDLKPAKEIIVSQRNEDNESEIIRKLKQITQGKSASVETLPDRICLSMLTPVLFKGGSAGLDPEAKTILRKVGAVIKDIPQHIMVEGHTDSLKTSARSKFKTNWELSAARAYSVVEFFTTIGIPASRLSIMGYGEYSPVTANDTKEGRQLNRRIEISILRW